MNLRGVKICCAILEQMITDKKIVADLTTGKACVNILHAPDPGPTTDHELTVSRDEITYCPGCGAFIEVFSQPLPAPETYTRTQLTGGQCNDIRCPNIKPPVLPATMGTCEFAQGLLTIGCWMTSAEVRSIVTDLRTSIKTNVEKTTRDEL